MLRISDYDDDFLVLRKFICFLFFTFCVFFWCREGEFQGKSVCLCVCVCEREDKKV